MSLQLPLATLVNNDAIFYLDVTFEGKALDLTNFTPNTYLKASAGTLDGAGHTYGIGTGLTLVTETLGKLKWDIPRAHLATAGTMWWRLDLTDQASNVFTVMYGPVTIKAV